MYVTRHHFLKTGFEIENVMDVYPFRCPRGVMIKALDCGIVVSEFELQSSYDVHFKTNTVEPPYPTRLWVK